MDTLTLREKTLILAAIDAVSPTGGGSETYMLELKLRDMFGIEYDDSYHQLVGQLQCTAHYEFIAATED